MFCGCNFPNCPRTSIYQASERDFRIVLAKDAISGLYERGCGELENIGVRVLSAAEVIESIARGSDRVVQAAGHDVMAATSMARGSSAFSFLMWTGSLEVVAGTFGSTSPARVDANALSSWSRLSHLSTSAEAIVCWGSRISPAARAASKVSWKRASRTVARTRA